MPADRRPGPSDSRPLAPREAADCGRHKVRRPAAVTVETKDRLSFQTERGGAPFDRLDCASSGAVDHRPSAYRRAPDDDRTLAASSTTAESGRLERHGRSRALVSSEARSLIGSLSMITLYRSADSNREPPGFGPGASTELG